MIRVFVGCDPNHCDAESQAVLEWSIVKHASEPVEIEWMKLSRDPESFWYSDSGKGWRTEKWATTFSGFRWAIPARCQYEGKAIYCDSDVIFMHDIAELWHQEFEPGKLIMAKGGGSWRLCVSMWNCSAAKGFVMPYAAMRSDPSSHANLTSRLNSRIVQPFSGDWNCLDGADYQSIRDPRIKAIHYTSIGTQPQLRYAIPRLREQGRDHWYNGPLKEHWRSDLLELFDELLDEAASNGYTVARYIQQPPYGAVEKRDLSNYQTGKRQ
jgi:hypothetical protein